MWYRLDLAELDVDCTSTRTNPTPHVMSSTIEASDLIWVTSSSNHAVNRGPVF